MPTPNLPTLLANTDPSPRLPFVAARAFLDATQAPDWTNRGLHDWFDRHLVSVGWMPLPIAVFEPGAGAIPLHGAGAEEPNRRHSTLLSAARTEVVTTLRGLIATPIDDRFLATAIFAGRVQRRRVAGATEWTPHPEPSAPLSAVVLSLLVADILGNRLFYEEQLSICDVCARVGFEEGAAARRDRCATHASPTSGIFPNRGGEIKQG